VCLVALDASVTIVNAKSKRSAPVEDVIKKGVKAGELVTQISFAIPKPGTFKYAKASRRALNSASIVTVAAVISLVKGVVADCRIALGGVAAKTVRAKSVEKLLHGKVFDDKSVTAAAAAAAKDIAPFTDAYASAWYRARVTPVHICRALLGNA
jgi:CO/xanthine dehydrogenase FAD-binding subunit